MYAAHGRTCRAATDLSTVVSASSEPTTTISAGVACQRATSLGMSDITRATRPMPEP
jgi:hypothetical protein